MLSNREKKQLLTLALAGNEGAFGDLLRQFDGLIWQQFQQQRVREKPEDWYQECRIVMHRCLLKLPKQHWGVLTIYFQRALYHHVTSLWRGEYQSKFDLVLSDECLTYLPVSSTHKLPIALKIEWVDLIASVAKDLPPLQRRLLVLKLQGYPMPECAQILMKSNSWCYQQWHFIQKYFVCLKADFFKPTC